MRAKTLLCALLTSACAQEWSGADDSQGTGESEGSEGSDDATEESSGTETGEPEELVPDPGPERYVIVGERFELDGSASTGAVLYQWNFADGTPASAPGPEPTASHIYAEPGRWQPVLTVWDANRNSLAASTTVNATLESVHAPRHSATIVALDPLGFDGVAVVSPDSDELTVIGKRGTGDGASFEVVEHHPVCDRPRTVSIIDAERLAVTCQGAEEVVLLELGGSTDVLPMPRGSRPFAAIASGDVLVVALAGTGELARFDLSVDPPAPLSRIAAIRDLRGLALWPDGRVAATRWRSPDDRGEVVLLDVATGDVDLLELAFDPTPPSDTEIGGVPTYLDQILVSPTATEAALPGLQANSAQGEYLTGQALTFETTVRAIVSWIEIDDGQALENPARRKQFDNRGFAGAGVHSSHGDYLFVAMPGNRGVERFDVLGGTQAGSLLDVGYAPAGVALSADDRFLYVDAALSREVRVYDVSDWTLLPQPIAILPTLSAEPLTPEILRGKQIFNDSFDPRISKHGYIACSHCHLDGEADLRTWDFTDRGEGLRNTISLLGRGGVDHGPIHWSANFDEVQDFENDIRGPFGGLGLLDDADWRAGTTSTTLGDPKAGLSEDLDALAAYVGSLDEFPRSPVRDELGQLTPDAAAGKLLFESPALGCTNCHAGTNLVDSMWIAPTDPLLHDVGTLGPGSGQRLGGPLTGIDTPTLHEVWNSPPYLHDGSAPDLASLLTSKNPLDEHGITSQLTAQQLDQLIAWLLSLEGDL